MANLVYYRDEKIAFKTAFEKKMSLEEADIVFHKLVRHFKLGSVYLNWTSGVRRPKAFNGYFKKIILNVDNNTFGVLCHELAHIREYVKFNKGGHNKRHWRFMKGMIAYCEKRNWFEAELQKRLAPKPIKPEPTKDELQARKIEGLKAKAKRYETKIKIYSNKLKKVQRKLKRLVI